MLDYRKILWAGILSAKINKLNFSDFSVGYAQNVCRFQRNPCDSKIFSANSKQPTILTLTRKLAIGSALIIKLNINPLGIRLSSGVTLQNTSLT